MLPLQNVPNQTLQTCFMIIDPCNGCTMPEVERFYADGRLVFTASADGIEFGEYTDFRCMTTILNWRCVISVYGDFILN